MAEPLRHTDGTPLVLFHGAADSVEFTAPDGPWEMHIVDDAGIRHVFVVHGISAQLCDVAAPLQEYWDLGRAAAAAFGPPTTDLDLDAYEPGSPKRISLERDR